MIDREFPGIAPVISVEVKGDQIIIADNGPGIPASVIDGVLDYSISARSGSPARSWCGLLGGVEPIVEQFLHDHQGPIVKTGKTYSRSFPRLPAHGVL
jgi:nitrogen-specific signal transduction histidine kinase